MSPTLAWVILVAALWGMIGLVRGALQPPAGLAHPLYDAALADPARDRGRDPGAGRLRIGVWWQRDFGQGGDAAGPFALQATLIGVILANIPASIGALRRPRGDTVETVVRHIVRRGPPRHAERRVSGRADVTRGLAWGAVARPC